jgi:hypothetical protein
MTKKWVAINLLLLAFGGLLGRHVRDLIVQSKRANKPDLIQPKDPRALQDKTLPPPAPSKDYIPTEFSIIPEKLIFSETRSNKEEQIAPAPVPEIPPLAQKPILVGTSISDNQQRALILDPTVAQDKGRRAQLKRIGDTYQGYTITRITAENIVLESGTRKETIPLHEGSKRAKGGKTPIQPTRIVSFGGSSGGGPGGAPGGGPGAPRTIGGSQVALTSPNTPQLPAGQPNPAAGAIPAVAPQPQQSQPRNVIQTPAGRVIRTPFGDVPRPD